MKRAEFAEPDPTLFYVLVNEDEATRMANGELPESVREAVRAMVDWRLEDSKTWANEARPKRKRA